jgi:hypothetical protein
MGPFYLQLFRNSYLLVICIGPSPRYYLWVSLCAGVYRGVQFYAVFIVPTAQDCT